MIKSLVIRYNAMGGDTEGRIISGGLNDGLTLTSSSLIQTLFYSFRFNLNLTQSEGMPAE